MELFPHLSALTDVFFFLQGVKTLVFSLKISHRHLDFLSGFHSIRTLYGFNSRNYNKLIFSSDFLRVLIPPSPGQG